MTTTPVATAPVLDRLIGQEHVIPQLSSAAAGHGMTHAWLLTGPPGSGRSTAARAFAAALQCPTGGCGHCNDCRQALGDLHPDVRVIDPDGLSIGVDEVRDLVRWSATSPIRGRAQVIVIIDADRLTEPATNALLKAVEEPAPATVWLLAAPSADDLLPTVRSRCRLITLRTPSEQVIAAVLVTRDGVEPAIAAYAAAASHGHVGRARRLALDDAARNRRREVLSLPPVLANLRACSDAAARLIELAEEESGASSTERDDTERRALLWSLGADPEADGARTPRGGKGMLDELERRQKSRRTRAQRDALDMALLDLVWWYRRVLDEQFGVKGQPDRTGDSTVAIERLARSSEPERTLQRIEALMVARGRIGTNANPLLTLEAMFTALGAKESAR